MKTLLALSFSVLAFTTAAHAEVNRQCWDGTFGYNYVNVVETARGVEVSLEGSTLHLPALYDTWNHSYVIGEFNHGSRVHALLPLSSKVEDAEGNITLSAKTIVVPTENGWNQEINPTLWLEHWTTNLGQSQKLITDIPVHVLKVELNKDLIKLSFKQARAPGEPALESVGVACHFDHASDTTVFPEELKTFLDAKAETSRK